MKFCKICGAREGDSYDGWCNRCHMAYLDGWMDKHLEREVEKYFASKDCPKNHLLKFPDLKT